MSFKFAEMEPIYIYSFVLSPSQLSLIISSSVYQR